MSKFKNIVFDLGGVIINIDPDRTFSAIKRMAGPNYPSLQGRLKKEKVLELFEVGELAHDAFRQVFLDVAADELTSAEFDLVWNAMLLDIPTERIELLRHLHANYNLYLLSNTNEIHVNKIHEDLKVFHNLPSFQTLFDQVYYSYDVGLRKPDPAIFEMVLEENELKPAETLFIDDTQEHIDTANKLGIQTHLLTSDQQIVDLFKR